jgi:hypothetical protein
VPIFETVRLRGTERHDTRHDHREEQIKAKEVEYVSQHLEAS